MIMQSNIMRIEYSESVKPMHGSLTLFKVMHYVFVLKYVQGSYRENMVKH